MSPRARAAKRSASFKSKKKSAPIQKQKSSPVKQHLEQTSTQPRQKRLSSLTAATLLQYCTSILSPARKLKSTSKKTPQKSLSENKPEPHIPTRARREASSRASAMIMQHNEIERSRYNYSLPIEQSTSTIRRHRSKSIVTNKDDAPPLPVPARSITNISNQTEFTQSAKPVHSTEMIVSKYPSLTEAILAEHNRLQEMTTAKQDNLLKWTQELALCGRLSPPYSADEIPPESSLTKPSNSKEIIPAIISSSSLDHLPSTNNVTTTTTPTFLFPSSTYSLDLRSFYPLLPSCWQYPSWPYQSSSIKHHRTSELKTKKSAKLDSLTSIHKQNKEAFTFHLHTHHRIHNSKTTVRLTPSKSSISIRKHSLVEPTTILPLKVHNAVKEEDQSISPAIENEVLNLSIDNNGAIKKTTRRKSSPVKRRINSGTKAISGDEKSIRRVPKRRSASAATASFPTIVSITGRNSRRKRTISATNRKRSHSPASISLPLTNNQSRKKQKVLHYWVLFGKSEQKLVSVDTDKPPVFRECYSSIRHVTEKDVIKSNDCVLLRSETGAQHGATPYLAKVKWFWEEPTTGEIQMSLIWYYHPEHTELPLRIRERFLPNELLASKYRDCVSVACIEDKCYVLNFNEYNRYCLREKSVNLFEHSEGVGQLKVLLNKTIPTIPHRSLPAKTVGNQNIFFCRYVYDYRVKRILKNPTFESSM